MSFTDRITRLFRGHAAFKRSILLEEEIAAEKKAMVPSKQAVQSGVRVVQNMAGALRMMAEND